MSDRSGSLSGTGETTPKYYFVFRSGRGLVMIHVEWLKINKLQILNGGSNKGCMHKGKYSKILLSYINNKTLVLLRICNVIFNVL